jgi:hypothetical protein
MTGTVPESTTVHDRLVALGADDAEAREVADFLSRFLPVDRPVLLTDEILTAARDRDHVLLVCLLAEEVEPDEEDLRMLVEADAADDGSRIDLEDFRKRLLENR